MNHPKCLFPSPKTFPLPGVSERNTAVRWQAEPGVSRDPLWHLNTCTQRHKVTHWVCFQDSAKAITVSLCFCTPQTIAMTFKCPVSWDRLWAKSWPCQVTGTVQKQQGPCTIVSTFFLPFLFLFCRPVMCHLYREKGWIPWQCSWPSSSSSGSKMDLTGQLALP